MPLPERGVLGFAGVAPPPVPIPKPVEQPQTPDDGMALLWRAAFADLFAQEDR